MSLAKHMVSHLSYLCNDVEPIISFYIKYYFDIGKFLKFILINTDIDESKRPRKQNSRVCNGA